MGDAARLRAHADDHRRGHRAGRAASTPQAVALDHMLTERRARHALPAVPELRRGHARSGLRQMLQHDSVVPGLSDGGAHVGMICDGSFPTTMHHPLDARPHARARSCRSSRWSGCRRRDTAETVGLLDRGLIAPGYRADLNVIDYDRLTLHAPAGRLRPAGRRPAADPAGERLYGHHRRRPGHLSRRRADRRPARPPGARRAGRAGGDGGGIGTAMNDVAPFTPEVLETACEWTRRRTSPIRRAGPSICRAAEIDELEAAVAHARGDVRRLPARSARPTFRCRRSGRA